MKRTQLHLSKTDHNIYFLLIILVIILSVVIILMSSSSKIVPHQTIDVSESKEPEYPIDTVNDGVYTDYRYGFTFEYPEELFEYKYGKLRMEISPSGGETIPLVLYASAHLQNRTDGTFYDGILDLFSLDIGRYVDRLSVYNLLRKDDKDDHTIIVISSQSSKESFYKNANLIAYIKDRKDDSLVYYVILGTDKNNTDMLEKHLRIYMDMIDSITFFDPQNPPNDI